MIDNPSTATTAFGLVVLFGFAKESFLPDEKGDFWTLEFDCTKVL